MLFTKIIIESFTLTEHEQSINSSPPPGSNKCISNLSESDKYIRQIRYYRAFTWLIEVVEVYHYYADPQPISALALYIIENNICPGIASKWFSIVHVVWIVYNNKTLLNGRKCIVDPGNVLAVCTGLQVNDFTWHWHSVWLQHALIVKHIFAQD